MKKGTIKWVDICTFTREKHPKNPLKRLSIFEVAGWIEEKENYVIIYTEKEVSGNPKTREYDYTIIPRNPIMGIKYEK
jgi:hypothetical protein